jgi:hypothetical protein
LRYERKLAKEIEMNLEDKMCAKMAEIKLLQIEMGDKN